MWKRRGVWVWLSSFSPIFFFLDDQGAEGGLLGPSYFLNPEWASQGEKHAPSPWLCILVEALPLQASLSSLSVEGDLPCLFSSSKSFCEDLNSKFLEAETGFVSHQSSKFGGPLVNGDQHLYQHPHPMFQALY